MNRQPIVNRAAIVSVVTAIVAILASFGVAVPDDVRLAVVELVAIAAPFAVAYWARRHTTPVDDPQDANGSPLVPAEAAATEPDGGAGAGSYSPEADDYEPEHAA
ncbi:hypothetical protein [Micromonospora sp. WMMD980]|uniref:hypothetical protein n=1 Tax=Micromonospora sp. WMMD980 TaxID=3016088 RepID=UPI0024174169|nr:hypothetical protein [Micromonospora sp. WMMD980]MDG4801733.1 hypothetical protein [Micromonospora sp. WMMD980]